MVNYEQQQSVQFEMEGEQDSGRQKYEILPDYRKSCGKGKFIKSYEECETAAAALGTTFYFEPNLQRCYAANRFEVDVKFNNTRSICLKGKTGQPSGSPQLPTILSALYAYDGCMGGVNDSSTDEEYMQELKRRNCTVVTGPGGKEMTNVKPSAKLKEKCERPDARLEWLDALPVTFSLPLSSPPARTAFRVQLNDGTESTPECAMLFPADEENERNTVLLVGEFGDGKEDTVWPTKVEVVEELVFFATFLSSRETVKASAGLVFSSPDDLRYTSSSVRMVSAKMWDVKRFKEGSIFIRYPGYPKRSLKYPNDCQYLFPSTTHVIRVTFSGGISRDGVTSLTPGSTGVFSLRTSPTGSKVNQLGLADLGRKPTAPQGKAYTQDEDNNLDICLEMEGREAALQEDFLLKLRCKGKNTLHPPKGKPYGCAPQQVLLKAGDFMKTWHV